MEAAEPWDRCDPTDCLRWSAERCILVERKVRACTIIICLVIGEQITNMPLSQRHDMIEALAPDRSDQPFNMTVLPRRAWRDRPIPDAHGSQPACDRNTVGGVTIADEIAWRLVPWEGFGDLSGDPFGGRMCGHIDPDEPSPPDARSLTRREV